VFCENKKNLVSRLLSFRLAITILSRRDCYLFAPRMGLCRGGLSASNGCEKRVGGMKNAVFHASKAPLLVAACRFSVGRACFGEIYFDE